MLDKFHTLKLLCKLPLALVHRCLAVFVHLRDEGTIFNLKQNILIRLDSIDRTPSLEYSIKA